MGTLGLKTHRDTWCYNSSKQNLSANIRKSIDYFNKEAVKFQATSPTGTVSQRMQQAKQYVFDDPQRFSWDEKCYRDLANGVSYSFDETGVRISLYRPYFRQYVYLSPELNTRIRAFPELFPHPRYENLGIAFTGPGARSGFSSLMSDRIVETGLSSPTAYLPRYRYDKEARLDARDADIERVSNINPAALAEFRQIYGDPAISEDDLFYYTYGILHSQQWRETFANDLAKSAARIPMAASLDDFRAFVAAGRELADLHVHYETVEPYPLEEIRASNWHPDAEGAFRVEKMKYAGKRPNLDTSTIIYNSDITLRGIPAVAHEYKLGTRSALDWLIDRYKVTTHNKSGIVNDPNDWADEVGEPRYILDLIKRVTTVSVRTVEIVNGLPELPI
ncbi:MAG: hypothetical protein OXI30_18560 [Chloroflexota bacterium]|nr:hypothetical protein [Chloroflexota bacterium]